MSRPECWAGVSLERRGVCAYAREEAQCSSVRKKKKQKWRGRSSTVLKNRRANIQVLALGPPLSESNRDSEPVRANKLVCANTLVVSFLRPRTLNDQEVANLSNPVQIVTQQIHTA